MTQISLNNSFFIRHLQGMNKTGSFEEFLKLSEEKQNETVSEFKKEVENLRIGGTPKLWVADLMKSVEVFLTFLTYLERYMFEIH